MKSILLFGAGKSATSLIEYLGKCCDENNWKLLVCDTDLLLAQSKIEHFTNAMAIAVNVSDKEKRHELITQADIVISMLPPALHFLVAKDCVLFSRNLLTASYIDSSILSLEKEIKAKKLLFIGEMGLDPGIDHMSAMKIIHGINQLGGKITSFKSHCGGLVSPESDNNPWHYKITWNPANVVSAGNAGAQFLQNDRVVEIDYANIFKEENNLVNIPGLGKLAWYPNRDSLSYIETYHLEGIQTFIRTTLRYPAFCKAWHILVNAGFTTKDDFDLISQARTFYDWYELKINRARKVEPGKYSEENIPSGFFDQIDYLGMRSQEIIPFEFTSSASIIQFLLETKLAMQPNDKDMIVMLHEIEYETGGIKKEIKSSLIVNGKDSRHTAMAQTVGLPLGIATKLILQNKITLTGLHLPVVPEIYELVLHELAQNGIAFKETVNNI